MKTITIWNMKGGVGKTTISYQLGELYASQGKRTLLIDLDPQANLTSFFEKFIKPGRPDIASITDAKSFQKAIQTAHEGRKGKRKIRFIAGSNSTFDFEHILALSEYLDAVKEDYDVCVIDTHPDTSGPSRAALAAADLVLVPMLLDKFSVDNLNLVDSVLQEIGNEIGRDINYRVVINRIANRKVQREIMDDLTARHDYPLLDIALSDTSAVSVALRLCKPLFAHKSKAVITADFSELAESLTKLLKEV